MNTLRKWLACAAIAGTVGLGATAANATTWLVDGTFTDGTTVTGDFSVNVYGFLDAVDLKTKDGFLTGAHYGINNHANGVDPGPYYIDLLPPDGQSELYIIFQNSLLTPSADNKIIGGYECQGSFSCNATYIPPDYTDLVAHDPPVEDTRFFAETAGSASAVPEVATWEMLILGAGLVGAGLRFRRHPVELAA